VQAFVEKSESLVVPLVAPHAPEKHDQQLEATEKGVFATKIHKALYTDQEDWEGNTWSDMDSNNNTSNS